MNNSITTASWSETRVRYTVTLTAGAKDPRKAAKQQVSVSAEGKRFFFGLGRLNLIIHVAAVRFPRI